MTLKINTHLPLTSLNDSYPTTSPRRRPWCVDTWSAWSRYLQHITTCREIETNSLPKRIGHMTGSECHFYAIILLIG